MKKTQSMSPFTKFFLSHMQYLNYFQHVHISHGVTSTCSVDDLMLLSATPITVREDVEFCFTYGVPVSLSDISERLAAFVQHLTKSTVSLSVTNEQMCATLSGRRQETADEFLARQNQISIWRKEFEDSLD